MRPSRRLSTRRSRPNGFEPSKTEAPRMPPGRFFRFAPLLASKTSHARTSGMSLKGSAAPQRLSDTARQAIVENYDRARQAQEAGDLASAAKLYRKVLDLWPTHAAARDRLGFV